MRLRSAAQLIVLALLIVSAAGVASAQTQLGGVNVEGGIEAGGRFYLDSRPSQKDRAKFEEYRDQSPGLFLLGANLRLSRPDESLYGEFGGSKWGFSDQDYYLSVGRLGTWQFDFLWDQTPHVISTTARLLATEPHPGVFVLPTPRPPLAAHNGAPPLDEIAVRWDTAAMRFAYSVSPNLDFAAEYARTQKSGSRPMGMAFGSPGANFYEVLQPIDQVVHDFRLRAAFADPLYQIQFGYTLSVFANDLNRIQADNPCFRNTTGVCSSSEQNGPATGQSSLPPSNMAHSLNLAGGVNLPLHTRINGNVAWGLNLQNDSFLPHTINSALAASTPGLALPHNSLNGLAQTWLVYLSATSRPFDPVTFTAKYRFYDHSDLSDKLTFQNVALNDSTIEPTRFAARYSFNKQNAELDARTRFLEIFALTTGVGWERWDRNEHREVPISNEYFAKLALDATPTEWLLARIAYTPSFRRINEYKTISVVGVLEDPGSPAALQGQSLLLRKFDESDRDRHKIGGELQFTFADVFTATPAAAWRFDNFYNSPLGLQNETGWSAGIDLSWTPMERVTFSGGYTYEQFLQKMRSRSRPVDNAGNVLDFHDFDWVTQLGDTVQTAYLGVKAALIPKVLDLRIDSAFSNALGRTETSNPTTPFSGSASQNATATAKPFPAFQDTLVRVEAQLIYYFLKNWSARLGYAFEKFNQNDWRTDTLNPFMGVSSIWLGNDLKNYTAHMMGMTLAYQFK